jgi:UDP-GlcNAc:undecaprenyl-phosphate GlcNAc-1-phosphate transferase
VLLAFLGAVLSFVIFNKAPARIFMGNAGSHFIGFFLGSMAIYLDYSSRSAAISLLIPFLLCFVPITDTSILMAVRISKGVSVAKKTGDHPFFYLENKVGYKKALAYFLVSSAVSCMAAIIVLVFFF